MITTTERQENLIDQHAALLNPSQARTLREAGLGIIESRREGAYVWDQSGTRYIDCRQETSIFGVGRRNPELISKLKSALDEYDLGNSLFFSEPRVLLAQKLGQMSPGGALSAVTFGVSDREINDFSLKLARAQTGRRKIIAMEASYHAGSSFAPSASGNERFGEPFEPLMPDIVYAKFGDIDSLRALLDQSTACVILEAVQTFAGIRVPPPGYLKQVRELCNDFGAMMIVDEIDTCLGRTGSMFAIASLGESVVPDIMTLGKALSGGLFPISAAVYRPSYLSFWEQNPFSHLSSFAGSDLGCVVGLETVWFIERNGLAANAKARGDQFAKGFARLLKKYSRVLRGFRARGLAMAVDYASEELGPQMSRDLSQFGVLASYSPIHPATMLIVPPLIITSEDVERILDAFDSTLAGAQAIVSPHTQYKTLEALLQSV